MESSTRSDSHNSPSTFTKGMTLSDYMAHLNFDNQWEGEHEEEEK